MSMYNQVAIKSYISGYYWASSILSDDERSYIEQYFVSRKLEDEIVELLGYMSSDSYDFKQLKRSAIYKFADFHNLVIMKQ